MSICLDSLGHPHSPSSRCTSTLLNCYTLQVKVKNSNHSRPWWVIHPPLFKHLSNNSNLRWILILFIHIICLSRWLSSLICCVIHFTGSQESQEKEEEAWSYSRAANTSSKEYQPATGIIHSTRWKHPLRMSTVPYRLQQPRGYWDPSDYSSFWEAVHLQRLWRCIET